MANTWEISNRLISDLGRDFPNLSLAARQGLVGALAMESTGFQQLQEEQPLVPGSKGGYGFAQWTGPRRRAFESFAAEAGLDPSSYEANYAYLKEELNGVGNHDMGVLRKLEGIEDAQQAQEIFTTTFLRPGIPHKEHRADWTRQVVANYVPIPGAEIPNVVATELDVTPGANLERMVPMPTARSEMELARGQRVNVAPGTINIQGGGSGTTADTFQLDRAVPLPRPRPKGTDGPDSRAANEAVTQVMLPELAPPGHLNVPLPRPRPNRASDGYPDMALMVNQMLNETAKPRTQASPVSEVETDAFGFPIDGSVTRFTTNDSPEYKQRMGIGGSAAKPAASNPMSREDTGQARPGIQLTPPPRISQRVLTDAEVEQALAPLSQANPAIVRKTLKDIPQSQIERNVVSRAGAKNVPVIGTLSMPEINQLGKLAPKVMDLENIAVEQTQIRQQEQQAAQEAQRTLQSQSTVKDITPAKATNPLESLGNELLTGLQDLLGIPEAERTGSRPGTQSGSVSNNRNSSGGSGSSSSSRSQDTTKWTGREGTLNGKVVREYESSRYNADTNTWEAYKGYK